MKTADEVVRDVPVPLSMGYGTKRDSVTFDGDIDWCHIPDQDVEWAYMLNRHRYWVALGQAYAMTGDEKYAECLASAWRLDRSESGTWRTYDGYVDMASDRGRSTRVNWIKALRYVIGSPS